MADDNQIRETVAQAMMDDSEVAETAATTAALANPKDLFCKNWDTVKQVLQFLKRYLPRHLQGIVDMIIKAGDALQKVVC